MSSHLHSVGHSESIEPAKTATIVLASAPTPAWYDNMKWSEGESNTNYVEEAGRFQTVE
jgi:hypothetical protein